MAKMKAKGSTREPDVRKLVEEYWEAIGHEIDFADSDEKSGSR